MRHPLLGAVRVAVNQVWRIGELHTAGAQRVVSRADVIDAQVEDRFGAGLLLGVKVEPRTTAVEEGERTEAVEVRESQGLPVPCLGPPDIPHRARDLCERTELVGTQRFLLVTQGARARLTEPAPQRPSVRKSELRHRV